MSANDCFGPFLFTRLDKAQDAVELFVRHERSDLGELLQILEGSSPRRGPV
jgi:hypothetical protein